VDINKADYTQILRIPGIGVKTAKLIIVTRRYGRLNSDSLKKMGVSLKKAQYFITCNELAAVNVNDTSPEYVRRILTEKKFAKGKDNRQQMALMFGETPNP